MRGARISLGTVAVLLTACGPSTPLHAGLAGNPQNLLLGRQPSPPTPPAARPPFAEFQTVFPVPVTLDNGVPAPVPEPSFNFTPVQPACPSAPPFAFPTRDAPTTPDSPPFVGGPFPVRYSGTITKPAVPGVPAFDVQLPSSGTLQVTKVGSHEVIPGDGGYQFTTAEVYNGYTTTTVYQVIRSSPAPAVPVTNVAPPAGLYLLSQTMVPLDPTKGTAQAFNPTPMILLLPFPAQPTEPFGGTGNDAADATAMVLTPSSTATQQQVQNVNGTPTPGPSPSPLPAQPPSGTQVIGHQRVDACGNVLDSWQVELVGHYDSNNQPSVDFDNTYDFATGYGGLAVSYHRHETGVGAQGAPGQFIYDVTATIAVVPH